MLQPEPAEAASRWQSSSAPSPAHSSNSASGLRRSMWGKTRSVPSADLHHYVSHLHIARALSRLPDWPPRHLPGRGMAWRALGLSDGSGCIRRGPCHARCLLYPWGLATVATSGLIYLITTVFIVGAVLALRPLLSLRSATDRLKPR